MKKTQKGFILPTAIILLVLVLAGGIYIYTKNKIPVVKDTSVNTSNIRGDNIISNSQVVNPVVIEDPKKTPAFDKFGFSIYLPVDWLLDVQTYQDQKSYKFTFNPDNNKDLWHGFGIVVYDYAPTIEKWIEKNAPEYKNKLTVTKENDFGGKPTYNMCDKSNKDEDACDSPVIGFNKNVTLGSRYSYGLLYPFQDSTYDYNRIIDEIYPNIIIK